MDVITVMLAIYVSVTSSVAVMFTVVLVRRERLLPRRPYRTALTYLLTYLLTYKLI